MLNVISVIINAVALQPICKKILREFYFNYTGKLINSLNYFYIFIKLNIGLKQVTFRYYMEVVNNELHAYLSNFVIKFLLFNL